MLERGASTLPEIYRRASCGIFNRHQRGAVQPTLPVFARISILALGGQHCTRNRPPLLSFSSFLHPDGNPGTLYRYNVSAGTFTQVDSGLLIELGHTSTLGFDKDGNLWLGEQPVADLPNGGRVRVYLATDLARLP